jgi:serpin B
VVPGIQAFGAALYEQLAGAGGNLCFAPVGISLALAMTASGARGETAAEMARALHFPDLEPPRLHAAFGALAVALREAPGVELAVAQALFGQLGCGFLPEFLALLEAVYGAGLQEVDFAQPEVARAVVNRWVEERTADKIRDLIPEGVLNQLTRLVLVNAIHFKGTWSTPFPARDTTEQPFFLPGGGTVPVPLMRREGDARLLAVRGGQLLELPYAGVALSMVVVLPEERDGLPALEARLGSDLAGWLGGLGGVSPAEVVIELPRFRIEASFRLNDALQRLGLRAAFDLSAADFSAVVHKAFLEVNEEGTEAAAATAVEMLAWPWHEPTDPRHFRADHPFLFLLRDRRTGCVLFLGRLVDPRG